MNQLRAATGLDRVTVIHLNDSLGELGSRVDRHTHIGKGRIGIRGFDHVVRTPEFRHVPMIIETPKDAAGNLDRRNLKILKRLRGARPAAARTSDRSVE